MSLTGPSRVAACDGGTVAIEDGSVAVEGVSVAIGAAIGTLEGANVTRGTGAAVII